VRYPLKTPYRDGTTHVLFEPVDFIARLAALVPKPRVSLTRYHGVFAPNSHARDFFGGLELTGHKAQVADKIVKEVVARLTFLHDVGLDYLSLDRSADTLSGGESQRIRLASRIGSGLTGMRYGLDEPSIGLHVHDIDMLKVLHRLVGHGNTVVVIEHNLDVIKTADWIIDLGPEGGDGGGRIIAEGTPEQIARNKASHTGRYLKPVLKRG
jgi:excinuclease ABC subunit A